MNMLPVNQKMDEPGSSSRKSRFDLLLYDVLLVLILAAGAYFRFTGLNWDENQHLHPDERFLTMVASSIQPVENIGEYFDTAKSSLNPNNRGYGFYVYGTLPLFIVRGIADLLNQTGYDQIFLVGRALSGFFDLLTVLFVYLIVNRLYRKRFMALVAAALTAGSVMQIQLSHYFAVDTFTTFFTTGAVYFAIRILTHKEKASIPVWIGLESEGSPRSKVSLLQRFGNWFSTLRGWDDIGDVILFGLFVGFAMASKINSGLVALLIPAAYGIRYLTLPEDRREIVVSTYLRNVIIAAIVCILTFRIFQPYAFTGPSFFNMIPSEKWIATMKEISAQSAGDVDFPPALQWARRPIWFAPENMILFGMGIPFGLAAFGGFLLMGWRIITANWKKHILLWGWTGVYFAWQATNWVRAMRYQVLDYPMFAVIAAWGIFAIWEKGKIIHRPNRAVLFKALAIVAGMVAVAGTLIYAYAFTRIYNRTMTRIAASEWIYQNVPSAINLKIVDGENVVNHPLAFRGTRTIYSEEPVNLTFKATDSGSLAAIKLAHLVDTSGSTQIKNLQAEICDLKGNTLTTGMLSSDLPVASDPRGNPVSIMLGYPLQIVAGESYQLKLSLLEEGITLMASGPVSLGLVDGSNISEILTSDLVDGISMDRPYSIQFVSSASGKISEISLPKIKNLTATSGQQKLQLVLSATPGGEDVLGTSDVSVQFPADNPDALQSAVAKFDPPVVVEKGKNYTVIITAGEGTNLALFGNKPALESSWDDPLPLGMNNISPFDYNSGPYRTDLNFEMYWDDNQEKLVKFLSTLQQADFIFMTSNRQWGTTPRVPERYPVTAEFYRNLLGCPVEKDIVWCYRVAEPGMFTGRLGFELVNVIQSDPNIGSFRINTQFAEEAFTVYDHPKVMIFKKQDDFDIRAVSKLLRAVDLSNVIHLTPRKASGYQGNLMLPADRLAAQQTGGTWIDLFDPHSLLNQYPAAGAVVWYLFISLLGWLAYPIVRIATRGLPDHGYGISKIIGLALLAYFSWLAGSIGIEYSRLTILVVFLTLLCISIILFNYQKEAIREDFSDLKKLFLITEAVSLALFLMYLGIRLGNPDLWHPYKGGEKPMDFSYLNAVLKSTSFPPYDPWYAGGYINYYYYGFVFVGTPVKLLGITPSVAYNLILPTLFSLVGTAAFSIGYTLVDAIRNPFMQEMVENLKRRILRTRMVSEDPSVVLPSDVADDEYESELVEGTQVNQPVKAVEKETVSATYNPVAVLGGIGTTLLLLILGNLGTIRMIWHGFIRLGSPTGGMENSTYLDRFIWSAQGFVKMLQGSLFPYPVGEWYWIPSRAIPGEAITEFPFFTFLYADLHAHMIALPLTLAALAWTLAFVLRGGRWKVNGEKINGWIQLGICVFVGGLIVGALRPTNMWDLPTYLVIGSLGILYSGCTSRNQGLIARSRLLDWQRKMIEMLVILAGFIGLTFLLYYPFTVWYGQGYNSIDLWSGTRTPSWSYFTHWGVFLVLIVSWLVQETYDWMATTPVSSLNRFKPYRSLLIGTAVTLALIPIILVIAGIGIAWMAFPLAVWAGLLLLNSKLPTVKRFVLFLIGTALVLTLVVEIVVLVGDIGRMNTVFKFYLQAWTLLSISAAFAFIQVFPRRIEWPGWLNTTWQVGVSILVFCAALFPFLAGADKIRDRISPIAPHTLDGAAYMATSTYDDNGVIIDLNQDYEAIQWMQQNIKGSPVIVEANTVEYRWGSRYTIYTGLPGVVGWNWHQRQQRAIVPSTAVTDRVEEIKNFYETTNRDEAQAFLQKYNVRYVIVGQLEYLYYPGNGLNKFAELEGDLWDKIYQKDTTTIYKVREGKPS